MAIHNTNASNDDRADLNIIKALQRRITHLENELLETKMELACSKSSEDTLKIQVASLKSELDSISRPTTIDDNIVPPAALNVPVAVPTSDPFSRKQRTTKSNGLNNNNNRKAIHHRATRRRASIHKQKNKVLNPGSCASAMNLLGLVDAAEPRTTNNTSSHVRLARLRRASVSSSNKVLKKNSCASGINMMDQFAITTANENHVQHRRGNIRSRLMMANQRQNRRPSNLFPLSSVEINRTGSGLLGTARISSVTLLDTTSRRDTRSGGATTRSSSSNNNRNAEWGLLG